MGAPSNSSARSERESSWLSALGLGFIATTLALPIVRSGIWDPFELRSIEFARRIAIGLFGATGFDFSDASNEIPSRGEVDRGELPFTLMALGLRLFGLHAWAGRLPLVVAGLLGLGATYLLVRRLADRAAATLSVLVLGTMPLYFLHARTMLGDGLTLAAVAVATTGAALALFDAAKPWHRAAYLGLAALGLGAGLMSRGLVLGVAVPLLAPSLAWLVLRLSGVLPRARATDACGALLLVLGLAAALLGVRLLDHALAAPERYFMWLGFGTASFTAPPTFDAVVGALGHGLFPWSALVPVALTRVTSLPPGLAEEARGRESALRLTVLLAAVLGLGAWGGLAPYAGVLPFGPVFALAVLVALSLRDLERGAPASRALGMTGAALIVLLLADFLNAPEKALVPFAVEVQHLPEGFKTAGRLVLVGGAGLSALTFFAAFLEPEASEPRPVERNDYVAWFVTLRDLWRGNLLFGACVVEAALVGFVGFDLLGERFPAFARFAAAGEMVRLGGRVAWLVLPALFVLPFAALALRDAVRLLDAARRRGGLGRFLPGRALFAAFGSITCGTLLSLSYYPALASQLSPQQSYSAFLRLAKAGEPLALVGTSSATAPYAAGQSVVALGGTEQAYAWLAQPGPRRWLLLRSDALPGLNSRYRGRLAKGNLPVLDAHSSEVLLASNLLLPGERNENPLARDVLDQAPTPAHPLDANLGGMLDVLGWEVTDLDGHPLRAIHTGRRYEFVVYFRVTARISGSWETFVHFDGFQRRFNGDHPTLNGRYPFSLWNVGDVIADRHEITLEPNFTRGAYQVYLGLYQGDRRMSVQRGAEREDRVEGGEIVVE